jgi:hypothetical protein
MAVATEVVPEHHAGYREKPEINGILHGQAGGMGYGTPGQLQYMGGMVGA